MAKKVFFIILFNSFLAFSQTTVSGVVYDKKGRLHNIKVTNINTRNSVYTNQEGFFEINAKVNDSLHFTSIFYDTKKLKLIAKDFKEKILIVLKENIFEIDEVEIKPKLKVKKFKSKTFNKSLRDEIREDIKRNPHLYGVRGQDIVFKFIANLFKRKRKKEKIVVAKYEQLDSLFETDNLLNKQFLEQKLKIKKKEIFLFLEFCEAKRINVKLLQEDKKMVFLDSLFKYSTQFNALPTR